MNIRNSFSLLRTNPLLTGNLKLVITSDYKLYLESFAINKDLSKDRFKHFTIKKGDYLKDVAAFFFKDVEASSIYEVETKNDQSVMYTDYINQFSDTYFSGAFYTEDVFYNEEFEYLAPLYIKKGALPKKFIILRIDGPGSLIEDSNSSNFRTSILNNWKLIKSFDLDISSDFGYFLNNNIELDNNFPIYPLYVKYSDVELSEISGIDVQNTGFVTKSINLDEEYQNNTPLFRTEEFFTNMWKDNNLLYPHILNLKFLFDDTPATSTILKKWSINRYVGFYIDSYDEIKTSSPYQGYELNKLDNLSLQNLSGEEVSQIPYLSNNRFIRDINGRTYSFQPFKNGFIDTQIYWIEYQSKFYRVIKKINDSDNIIGDYLYIVIADISIENVVDKSITNPQAINEIKKVIINDLNTFINTIRIIPETTINNTIYTNLLENINESYTVLERVYQWKIINNVNTYLFRIDVKFIDNNLFTIENFSEYDLILVKINDIEYVLKRYAANIVNVGGRYYAQTDWSINVDSKNISTWINNGNVTKDINYYKNVSIENIPIDLNPPTIKFYRCSFSDIKDFDFDRTTTKATEYEYEKKWKTTTTHQEESLKAGLNPSIESKMYAPEWRDVVIKVRKLNSDYARRQPILDINNRSYLTRYLLGEENPFTSSVYKENELYIMDFENNWELYQGEYFREPGDFPIDWDEQAYLSYYKDVANAKKIGRVLSGFSHYKQWGKKEGRIYFNRKWSNYINSDITLPRKYYREENYIFRIEDNQIHEIDFLINSDVLKIEEKLTWGTKRNISDNREVISDKKTQLPSIKASIDPKINIDINYIPVSSEYISTDELFELRDNNTTDIWDKNQSIVKWGFLNSIGRGDYPYRLNYNLSTYSTFNEESNPYSGKPFPVRRFRDLDYFYRFGLLNVTDYQNYTLHLKSVNIRNNFSGFDPDTYLRKDINYFEYLFTSDQNTCDGLKLTQKSSTFNVGNGFEGANTLFKGIKYYLLDVSDIEINKEEYTKNGRTVIQDIDTIPNNATPNTIKYQDYKFSVIFSRKQSDIIATSDQKKGFNWGDEPKNIPDLNGKSDNKMGVDIYLNEFWKNVVVHIYIDTDDVLQLTNPVNKVLTNAETCEVDMWYEDSLFARNQNPILWDNLEFKINGIGIGIRPRDFTLNNFLILLENYNYQPPVGRNRVRFIRCFESNNSSVLNFKIMDYSTTDFILKPQRPTKLVLNENAFNTDKVDVNLFDINNTLKNRIILDDDINDLNGSVLFTSDGLKVNSNFDLNSYNDYPIAKVINEDFVNRKLLFDLDENVDPSIWRHFGPFVPIFSTINLFRPYGYLNLNNTSKTPKINTGNWKFYDPLSDTSKPNVYNFGMINEIIYSKVNTSSNILKIQDSNSKEKSIYPMVDEFGYNVMKKYIFSSNWEPGFNIFSRSVVITPNEYPTLSGYAPFFDGNDDYLVIPDVEKFNLEKFLIEDTNYENYILTEPQSERSSSRYTLLSVDQFGKVLNLRMVVKETYNIRMNIENSTTPITIFISAHVQNTNNKIGIQIFNASYNIAQSNFVDIIIDLGGSIYTNLDNAQLINSNLIDVQFTFKTELNRKCDISPLTFNITSKQDNILDIDIGEFESDLKLLPESVNSFWGGYLKLNSKENGMLVDYPFRINFNGQNSTSSYSDIFTNLTKPSGHVIGTTITSNLPSRGFSINTKTSLLYRPLRDLSKNIPILRIANAEEFSFEPERWTYIRDGGSIIYIGQSKEGEDVNRRPEITVEWSLPVQKRVEYEKRIKKITKQVSNVVNVALLDVDIHNRFIPKNNGLPFTNSFNVFFNLPFTTYNNKNGHTELFLKSGYRYTFTLTQEQGILNYVNMGNTLSLEIRNASNLILWSVLINSLNISLEFTFALNENSRFITTTYVVNNLPEPLPFRNSVWDWFTHSKKLFDWTANTTLIRRKNINKIIVFNNMSGVTINLIGKTTRISQRTEILNTTEEIVEEIPIIPKPEYLQFNIFSDNDVAIPISLSARHPDNYDLLNALEIQNLINATISPRYNCEIKDTKPNKRDIKIYSTQFGSYFNFRLENLSKNINIVDSKIKMAVAQYNISERFNKTSLKGADKRSTSYLNDLTIELWARVDSWSKDYETILYKGNDASFVDYERDIIRNIRNTPGSSFSGDGFIVVGATILINDIETRTITAYNTQTKVVTYSGTPLVAQKVKILTSDNFGDLYSVSENSITYDPWDDSFTDFSYVIGKWKDTDNICFRTCHKDIYGRRFIHNLVSNTEIQIGDWNHYAFVADSQNRSKQIYINGILDVEIVGFIEDLNDFEQLDEREQIAIYFENRTKIIPNSFNDTALATKIRDETNQSSDAIYWYNVFTGRQSESFWDTEFELKNYSITQEDAFKYFIENYENFYYYINSEFVTNGNNTWDILIATDSKNSLGRRNFNGAIDELRFWNYARNSTQIITNFNRILRTDGYLDPLKSLIAYYRFDEGKGVNVLKDLMSGKMIKDLVRWGKIRTIYINDGNTERETDDISYYQYENLQSPYWGKNSTIKVINSKGLEVEELVHESDILVNLKTVNWDVSGAEILGYSDERYVSTPPLPSQKSQTKKVEVPRFVKTLAQLDSRIKPTINIKNTVLNVTRTITNPVQKTTTDNRWWFNPIKFLLPQSTILRRLIGRSGLKNYFRI